MVHVSHGEHENSVIFVGIMCLIIVSRIYVYSISISYPGRFCGTLSEERFQWMPRHIITKCCGNLVNQILTGGIHRHKRQYTAGNWLLLKFLWRSCSTVCPMCLLLSMTSFLLFFEQLPVLFYYSYKSQAFGFLLNIPLFVHCRF